MSRLCPIKPLLRQLGDNAYRESEAAFQRAFKSHMGMTPAQWRKTQELSSADLFPVRRSLSKAAQ
jgi:methylphosphotriester-DNA--protein-cysteine methyltransferase